MEQGKQGATVLKGSPQQLQNPIDQIQTRYKHLENGFKLWLSKQSIAVEAAVVSATSAAKWFAIAGFATPIVGSAFLGPDFNIQSITPIQQAYFDDPFMTARSLAISAGVYTGIRCVSKRLRGKEHVPSSVAAAFGSGAMFALLCGMGETDRALPALSYGLIFASAQTLWSEIDECFSRYAEETRNKKNFKKGLLSDNTLPLPNDSPLRDVEIPLHSILDHIQREQDLRDVKIPLRDVKIPLGVILDHSQSALKDKKNPLRDVNIPLLLILDAIETASRGSRR